MQPATAPSNQLKLYATTSSDSIGGDKTVVGIVKYELEEHKPK